MQAHTLPSRGALGGIGRAARTVKYMSARVVDVLRSLRSVLRTQCLRRLPRRGDFVLAPCRWDQVLVGSGPDGIRQIALIIGVLRIATTYLYYKKTGITVIIRTARTHVRNSQVRMPDHLAVGRY